MGMVELWTPERTAGAFVFLLDVVMLKGSVLVGLGALTCLLARRASASVRHGIWASLFLVLLVVPWAPRVQTGPARSGSDQEVGSSGPAATMPGSGGAFQAVVSGSVLHSRGRGGGVVAVEPEGRLASWSAGSDAAPVAIGYAPAQSWLVWLWLVGALFGGARLVTGLRRTWRIRRRAAPAPPQVVQRAEAMARELGLRRVPGVLVSGAVEGPAILGAVRPVILVPDDVEAWPTGAVEAALLHELSHLQRRDLLVHLSAEVVRAFYWLNPAVHYAQRRLALERERACDDGVIHRSGDPVEYAEVLLGFALRSRRAHPVLSLAARTPLGERVKSLLDPAQARSPLGRRGRITMTAAAVALIAGVGAVEPISVAPPAAQHPAEELSSPDPATRLRGAWGLGEAEDPRHLPALIEALADPEPRVRVMAAWALGEIKDARAIEPLEGLLSDSGPLVREMAVLALGEIEDDRALPALESVAEGQVSGDALCWALAQIRHDPGVSEVFAGRLSGATAAAGDPGAHLRALASRDAGERARAAEALGSLGSVEAVDALLGAVSDSDPVVRARVIWALDEINPSREDRPLRR